jgi:hypothetical protein
MGDKVSHPYKITCKTTVLHIVNFKILRRKQEDKFSTE